jgi:hypothetical protein
MQGFGLKYIDKYGKIKTLDEKSFKEYFDVFMHKPLQSIKVVSVILDEFKQWCTNLFLLKNRASRPTNYVSFKEFIEEVGVHGKGEYKKLYNYALAKYSDSTYPRSFMFELYTLITDANKMVMCSRK